MLLTDYAFDCAFYYAFDYAFDYESSIVEQLFSLRLLLENSLGKTLMRNTFKVLPPKHCP
jgi:hypothetical protein